MAFTTDDLISSIQRGVTLPSYDPLLSTNDLLAFATEEMQTKIVPIIRALRQEYFVVSDEVALVDQQDVYTIPERAIGRTLRDLKLVSTSNYKRKLVMIPIEEEHLYTNGGTSGEPIAFFPKGDTIVVRPKPIVNTAYYLQMWYEQRPSELIQVANGGIIQAIDTVNSIITVDTVPQNASVSTTLDIISQLGGHPFIGTDLPIVAVTGFNIQLSALPTKIALGQYVAQANHSQVVQLPNECFPVLAQAVQCRILEAIGDMENLQAAKQTLTEKIIDMQKLLAPRNEGSQQKVTNNNGLLRRTNQRRFVRRFY